MDCCQKIDVTTDSSNIIKNRKSVCCNANRSVAIQNGAYYRTILSFKVVRIIILREFDRHFPAIAVVIQVIDPVALCLHSDGRKRCQLAKLVVLFILPKSSPL